jgi:hypothetical protein
LYPYNAAYCIAADLSRQIEQKKQKLSRSAHLVASRYGEEILTEFAADIRMGVAEVTALYNSHVIYLRRYEQLCNDDHATETVEEHQQ